jgi:hypothetical protein
MMEEYWFLYKDSTGEWNQCTNPVFIAEHKCCVALNKKDYTLKQALREVQGITPVLYDGGEFTAAEGFEDEVIEEKPSYE